MYLLLMAFLVTTAVKLFLRINEELPKTYCIRRIFRRRIPNVIMDKPATINFIR